MEQEQARIVEAGSTLRLEEPAPEGAQPRRRLGRGLGYDEGAQRLRPERLPPPQDAATALVEQMGEPLGLDLSDVRVQFNSSEAREQNAEGLVAGGDMQLAIGPEGVATEAGEDLVAHEVVHLAQQTRSATNEQGDDTEVENEANQLAGRVARGLPATPQATASRDSAHFKRKSAPRRAGLDEAQVQTALQWYGTHRASYTPKRIRAIQAKVGTIVDGWIGPMTVRAIATWQARHGLVVDGIAGPVTQGAMFAAAQRPSSRPQNTPKPRPQNQSDKLEAWNRRAPAADYHRLHFRGVIVNRRTKELVMRAETIMREVFQHRGFAYAFSQGSYHRGVAASAGTHDGGGALDIRTSGYTNHIVDDMVEALRMAGFAAWSRGRGHDSFAKHIHAIAIGDKQAAWLAKQQVRDFAHGQNGLANHARDSDRHVGRPSPSWASPYLRA